MPKWSSPTTHTLLGAMQRCSNSHPASSQSIAGHLLGNSLPANLLAFSNPPLCRGVLDAPAYPNTGEGVRVDEMDVGRTEDMVSEEAKCDRRLVGRVSRIDATVEDALGHRSGLI